MVHYDREQVAALVDHTLLKPEATERDVIQLAQEAAELGVCAICVSPSMVDVAKSSCGPGQIIAAVAGFPSGKHVSAIKAYEARFAVAAGATEIDMVIDIGAAVAGEFDAVRADIAAVRSAIGVANVLKVIVESAALLDLVGEKALVDACRAAAAAGADFVKTSTGFHPAGGASVRAVEVMAASGRPRCRGQGQRWHPHRSRRDRDARGRRDAAGAVGHACGAGRFRRQQIIDVCKSICCIFGVYAKIFASFTYIQVMTADRITS